MFVIAGMFLGVLAGVFAAKRRKGNLPDILQYAAVYAMAFGLLGLFVTIFVHRMSLGG